jgi:uncharacterized membrane protein
MKTKLVNLIIILLIFATTLAAIILLPDSDVPTHFGPTGEPDAWGSKYTLLVLPAVTFLIWILADRGINVFTQKPKFLDAEKAESDIRTNKKAVDSTITAMSVIMLFINFGVIYMTVQHLPSYNLPEVDVVKAVAMLLGLLMIFMGNIMPKTRANSLIGFRCRWTMYNEATWRKSNLFAGICGMICGVISIVLALIFDGFVAVMIWFAIMLCASAIMLVYAYNVYKKEKSND